MLNGISANTSQHMLLDAGVVYTGFTSPSSMGTVIGATRGGNSFEYTPEVRDMPVDGAPGKVKGYKRILSADAKLTVNMLEVTVGTAKASTVGLTSEDYPASPGTKTHDKIVPTLEIALAEYKNIAFVCKMHEKDEYAIIVLKNALSSGPLSISAKEKDEAVMAITFEAHFDSASLGEVPFEMYIPIDKK